MINHKVKTMISSLPLLRYIPDDEYSVSIKEAKLITIDPIYNHSTVLDIVEQFVVINDRYYHKETLIRGFSIAKKEETNE